jgi:RNA 3'-phosphate cyclase
MLEIDGSIGEGGGQILRTALAISAMTLRPIKIYNIRKNRPKPGLKPQHMMGVKILADFTDAEVVGLIDGSTDLIFKPTRKNPIDRTYNIGTAGSISLLIQAITPFCISVDKPINLKFIGGTNVKWSPPIDYIKKVTIPILQKMDINFDIELIKRGFYPKGGGIVRVNFYPTKVIRPLIIKKNQKIKKIYGLSYASNLPKHVVERQAKSAYNLIKNSNLFRDEISIKEEISETSLSPGSGILIYALLEEGGLIGSDFLGERGLPAEKVGENAAINLINQLRTSAGIDVNMADMVLLYMAFANGKSVIHIPEITNHTKTNMKIIELMIESKFKIEQIPRQPIKIEIEGKRSI